MKACPFCAEEIQDAAIVCKHCGRDLSPAVAKAGPAVPATRGGTALATAKGCFFLVIGVIGMSVFVGFCSALTKSPTPTPAREVTTSPKTTMPTPAPTPQAVLSLLSSRGYESETGNYWYVEGQVKNIGVIPIKNVQVVATWYTKDDAFITADNAMIEYNPILPGQTSTFKTMTRSNPAMSNFSVAFKTLFGGVIETHDERPKKKSK